MIAPQLVALLGSGLGMGLAERPHKGGVQDLGEPIGAGGDPCLALAVVDEMLIPKDPPP